MLAKNQGANIRIKSPQIQHGEISVMSYAS